ncbi:MAG: polysaccharide biosynthesis protein [Bacilli bacterium]|nr:polysaccharide biosynthesis protein [Bacilli bacterium]
MKKVLFISSTGGHLTELLELKGMFKKYDYTIITEKTKSNNSLKEEYPGKVHFVMYGTRHKKIRYIFVVLANIFINFYYFLKIRPDVVISTGAHTAVPMCILAKLFRKKVIYIETFANIKTKTITGRILYKFADLFIVQWESMLELYPKAVYGGWIF